MRLGFDICRTPLGHGFQEVGPPADRNAALAEYPVCRGGGLAENLDQPPPPHDLHGVVRRAHGDGSVGDPDAALYLPEVGQPLGENQFDADSVGALAHQAEGGTTGGFVAHRGLEIVNTT